MYTEGFQSIATITRPSTADILGIKDEEIYLIAMSETVSMPDTYIDYEKNKSLIAIAPLNRSFFSRAQTKLEDMIGKVKEFSSRIDFYICDKKVVTCLFSVEDSDNSSEAIVELARESLREIRRFPDINFVARKKQLELGF